MSAPLVYRDGTPVPKPEDRCGSRCRFANKDKSAMGNWHYCKMAKGHTEKDHRCICGKDWQSKEKTSA